MIQLVAPWKKDSKNGLTYYRGKLGNGRLLLFEIEKRRTEGASEAEPSLTD